MNIELTDHTVAVTGAANGIGRAIASAFLNAGCRVVAIDRDAARLDDLRGAAPERIDVYPADVTDYDSLQQIAASCEVDHLVCAAAKGSGKTGFPFWNLAPSDWQSVVEVTLMGTIHAVQAFVPALLVGETQRKSVLLISSVAGQIGSPTDPPYSACKAAVINFAQIAAKDFAEYGIRVNAISPGMVQTDLNRSVYESSAEAKTMSYEQWGQEKVKRVAPLGRWQTPEEIASMALFLASEHARNITGQTINIDGGQVMHS